MKKIDIKGDIISNDYAWIYNWIGWDYTSPNKIQQALEDANGDDVEFHVNSPGGEVFSGYDIYNMIKSYKGKTTSKLIGLAASCASFIPMASDKVLAAPMAMMMIHGASTITQGNQQSHEHTREFLAKVDSTIVKAYTLRNGKTDEEMLELMAKETWFTPDEMLELGLIDGIIDEKEEVNKVKAYNTAQDEEKKELIDKLMSLGSVENIKKALLENQLNLGSTVVNSAFENTKKEEEEEMKLENFKSEHADLYNQIVEDAQKEAVTNERARIASINALAKPGVEDQIKKGIEDGLDAGQVAINILNAQTALNQAAGEAAKKDAEESGLQNVDTTPAPQNTEVADKEESVNLLVAAAKTIAGGRR